MSIELSEAQREAELLRRQLQDRGVFGELIGRSECMRAIYSLIEQVAPSSASVLLTGDSGTGKELVARAIHNSSPRKDRLLVKVNCAVIPSNLI